MAAMRISEGLRILQGKLADIEDEHDAELAANETLQDSIDAKAEARALTAVFDFLQTFKIAPTESLLRMFRRYLHASNGIAPNPAQWRSQNRGRAKGLGG
jgi:hypothetical protein